MDWIKKHTDTVVILGAVISSILWMNTKFNEVDARFSEVEKDLLAFINQVDGRFSEVEKDLAVIKTVLIMKNVMPMELANSSQNEEKIYKE